MNDIEWKSSYEVGNAEIDSEHKVFVILIQKINTALKDKSSDKKIERLIRELSLYTEFHFCSEENVMIDTAYPDAVEHKAKHEELLGQLKNLIFMFDLENRDLNKLIEFLLQWFVGHTINEDKKLAAYLKNKI